MFDIKMDNRSLRQFLPHRERERESDGEGEKQMVPLINVIVSYAIDCNFALSIFMYRRISLHKWLVSRFSMSLETLSSIAKFITRQAARGRSSLLWIVPACRKNRQRKAIKRQSFAIIFHRNFFRAQSHAFVPIILLRYFTLPYTLNLRQGVS